MKNKILNLFYLFYDYLDAPEFYFLSALLLISGIFLFLAGAVEPRPDLFYPKIITTIIGSFFLIVAIYKHRREGL